ncbi:hypothetical protein AB1Y20_018701 [Prymnesium parvum]|uniref:Hexosyltransferase n=1 Tax=Prymnesium parvum TaxID=97485 RepID=A0AB34JS67_PRYPA
MHRALLPAELQASLRGEVRRALASPSSCVPDGAVLLSTVDRGLAPLRPLQFQRVRHQRCLLQRVVSLCWNHSDAYGVCVPAPLAALTRFAVFSPGREVAYHLNCWVKWAMLSAALLEAKVAFYVDADVLLLRNPFTAPRVEAFSTRERCDEGAQLLYQWEGPGSNPLNSGQLLACSSAVALRALSAMPPQLMDGALPPGVMLDQEYAYNALRSSGHGIEQLPQPAFAGNCWFGPPQAPPWCDVYLFHAHCTSPGAMMKSTRMTSVLLETRDCSPDLRKKQYALIRNHHRKLLLRTRERPA